MASRRPAPRKQQRHHARGAAAARPAIATPAPTPAPAATAPSTRAHLVHLALLLSALALAYLMPFELLVLAYAILGPAHYLTEISWLHDRRYFLPHRGFGALLAAVALGAMFLADPIQLGALVSFCFVACAILAAHRSRLRTAALLAIAAACFAVLSFLDVPFGLAWVLLPTLVHISLFTLVFMTVGAMRSRSRAQFGLVAAYLLAIVAILAWPPSPATVLPALAPLGPRYFGDIATALRHVLGLPQLAFDARLAGLLSFAYTYHYLNWFIKADVIRWHAVPRPRLAAIALLSLGATALYFYDYEFGFLVLLLLSLVHVLLEFPLNSLSFRQLGGGLAALLPRRPAAAPG